MNIEWCLRETGSYQIMIKVLPNNVNNYKNIVWVHLKKKTTGIDKFCIETVCESPSIRSDRWIRYTARNSVEVFAHWKEARFQSAEGSTPSRWRLATSGTVRTLNAWCHAEWLTDSTTVLFSNNLNRFRTGSIVNTHNAHMWSSEKPHITVWLKVQHKFSFNICVGILGNPLLG